MTWQCPYTPLELHQFNPHDFDYGDRVGLPDGRSGTVSKVAINTATSMLMPGLTGKAT